jgi:hypothetical protein
VENRRLSNFEVPAETPPQMEGSIFNADKAYDSDRNCMLVYEKGMKPNIKQRETPKVNRGLRFRRRAAKKFNQAVYR